MPATTNQSYKIAYRNYNQTHIVHGNYNQTNIVMVFRNNIVLLNNYLHYVFVPSRPTETKTKLSRFCTLKKNVFALEPMRKRETEEEGETKKEIKT